MYIFSIKSNIFKFLNYFHNLFRKILRKKKFYVYTNYPFNRDGLATKFNFEFIKQKDFLNAYNVSMAPRMEWRAHVLGWAAKHAINLGNGDFVECGTHTGGTASFVFFYSKLYETNKKFYLIDTFTGLVENLISNEEKKEWKKNKVDPRKVFNCDVESVVRDRFRKYKNIKIVKGEIPKVLQKLKIKKISYLHIDLNSAIPEIAALNFFWDKIPRGGVIIADDYGWPSHTVQKKEWDKFIKSKKNRILSLPTGQGLIIKD
jgi:hypothetical protein